MYSAFVQTAPNANRLSRFAALRKGGSVQIRFKPIPRLDPPASRRNP